MPERRVVKITSALQRVAKSMRTDLVLDALEQTLWSLSIGEGFIHHLDRGSQYLSIR
jgi:putative transposase